ncbi:MAG: RluA family pseudouridine synthase [Clostridia bacterium]|nr:RluA family pseudouridine synthase [Clostridia bacterium]
MFEVLYSDKEIVVIIKPCGVLSEDGEGSACALIREALSVNDVYPIHRLDRDVSGVMVYALTKNAAAKLSRAVTENALEKVYLAVVHGIPEHPSGVFTDLLFKDSKKNKSYVVKRERKGVRRAELSYEVLESANDRSLVRVKLHTGRSHQIRVQFASRKMPLFGDRKYGADDGEKQIALFSHCLVFPHPTGGIMTFSKDPDGEIWKSLN